MGQATGLFIYARNIYFINKHNKIDLSINIIVNGVTSFFKDVFNLIKKSN